MDGKGLQMPDSSMLTLCADLFSKHLLAGDTMQVLNIKGTLMAGKGLRMPDSSMLMLCARRCSTSWMSAARAAVSRRSDAFSTTANSDSSCSMLTAPARGVPCSRT